MAHLFCCTDSYKTVSTSHNRFLEQCKKAGRGRGRDGKKAERDNDRTKRRWNGKVMEAGEGWIGSRFAGSGGHQLLAFFLDPILWLGSMWTCTNYLTSAESYFMPWRLTPR